MPIAMCKACQNIYMVAEGGRQYCMICGGDPVLLEETSTEAPPEEALAEGQAEAEPVEDMVPRADWDLANKAIEAQMKQIVGLQTELDDARGTLEAVSWELGSIAPTRDYDTVVAQAEAVKGVVSGLEGELEDARAELEVVEDEPTEPEGEMPEP